MKKIIIPLIVILAILIMVAPVWAITFSTIVTDNDGMFSQGTTITTDSRGVIWVAYTKFGKIGAAYSNNGGLTWSFEMVANNTGGEYYCDPSIAVDGIDNIYIVFDDEAGGFTSRVLFNKRTSLSGWGAPAEIDSDAYEPSIAVDSSNHVHLLYTNAARTKIEYREYTGSWSGETILADYDGLHTNDWCDATIAVDYAGKIVAIWTPNYVDGSTYYTYGIACSIYNGSSWSSVEYLDDPAQTTDVDGCTTYPKIAIDSNNLIHITYSLAGAGVEYTNFNGSSWSTATEIMSGELDQSISIDESNTIYIATVSTTVNHIYYYNKISGGAWSGSINVATGNSLDYPFLEWHSYPAMIVWNNFVCWSGQMVPGTDSITFAHLDGSNIGVNPIVQTSTATLIATTSATLNGNLIYLGSQVSVNVFFKYGLTSSMDLKTTPETKTTAPIAFNAPIINLVPGRTYYYQACVSYGDGLESYGTMKTFDTMGIQKPTSPTTQGGITLGKGQTYVNRLGPMIAGWLDSASVWFGTDGHGFGGALIFIICLSLLIACSAKGYPIVGLALGYPIQLAAAWCMLWDWAFVGVTTFIFVLIWVYKTWLEK